ncbi:MAG: class I SAM-dependent methyltransferase [Longimicrobiaceae bacterium]
MSGAPACPVCGSARTAERESADVAELARAWARQPHLSGVRGEARLAREIRADLGVDEVRFCACGACGVEFAEPMRGWSAGHYPDEEYGLGWDHLRALELLSASPPLRLLEIGCAEGRFLERAAALGHRATGLDFTAAAVRAACARGLDAREGDVAALRAVLEPGERFQAVAMFQIIEHLRDPHALFGDLDAVAAPGALLLVGCPSPRRYTRRVAHPERLGRSDFWDWPPQHTLRWGEPSLRRFLARHGWRVERAEHEPFSLVGAAAHVAGLRLAGPRARTTLRRRVETARALLEVAAARARGPLSGVRLLVAARKA